MTPTQRNQGTAPRPDDRLTAYFANAALACFAVFALGVALMHLLRSDLDVSVHRISAYSTGPWGGLMTTALAGASLGCLMLALGLARNCSGSAFAWLAAVMFAVASMAFAATAAYPTEVADIPTMASGDIRNICFVVNIASIVVAALLTGSIALRDARWRQHRVPAALLALLLLLAVVVQFRALHLGLPHGIPNRFVVAIMMIWLVVTAMRLRRLGRPGE